MFSRLSDFFYKITSGRNVLIFILLQMIIASVILPAMQNRFDPDRNRGLMDLTPGFSPDQGYQFLESYGETGREAYLFTEWAVDIIYPVIYSIAFSLLLSLVFKKAFVPGQFISRLNILPLAAALGDFIENAGIITMVKAFPARADTAAVIASYGGLFKWGSTFLTVILLLAGLVGWAFRKKK